jgi:hypothetical protein
MSSSWSVTDGVASLGQQPEGGEILVSASGHSMANSWRSFAEADLSKIAELERTFVDGHAASMTSPALFALGTAPTLMQASDTRLGWPRRTAGISTESRSRSSKPPATRSRTAARRGRRQGPLQQGNRRRAPHRRDRRGGALGQGLALDLARRRGYWRLSAARRRARRVDLRPGRYD